MPPTWRAENERRVLFGDSCRPELRRCVSRVKRRRVLLQAAEMASRAVGGLADRTASRLTFPRAWSESAAFGNDYLDPQQCRAQVVTNEDGWIHKTRLRQFWQLFSNACRLRAMPDADVNINLEDNPKPGYFNFCRERNAFAQFLLPNHRFTLDEVYQHFTSTAASKMFPTYDEQLGDLLQDAPFESKLPRAFAMLTPHADKVPLMDNAIRAPNDLTVYVSLVPILAQGRKIRGHSANRTHMSFSRSCALWEWLDTKTYLGVCTVAINSSCTHPPTPSQIGCVCSCHSTRWC